MHIYINTHIYTHLYVHISIGKLKNDMTINKVS
jgi:hypothetical protein